jgi:Flp pilus assembly protein TadG
MSKRSGGWRARLRHLIENQRGRVMMIVRLVIIPRFAGLGAASRSRTSRAICASPNRRPTVSAGDQIMCGHRPTRPRLRAPAGPRRWRPALGECGTAMVEFAILAPIFLGLLGAIMEFSGIMFVQTLLEGSAREASRYGITGSTEPGVSREDEIMNIVRKNTYGIIDLDKLNIETLVYHSFADIGQPEPYTDTNGNGSYDTGEPFTDVNGNGTWDPDMGSAGLGGPGDIVVYQMSYDWHIMIPLFRPFFGDTVTLKANVAVRNEPYE